MNLHSTIPAIVLVGFVSALYALGVHLPAFVGACVLAILYAIEADLRQRP